MDEKISFLDGLKRAADEGLITPVQAAYDLKDATEKGDGERAQKACEDLFTGDQDNPRRLFQIVQIIANGGENKFLGPYALDEGSKREIEGKKEREEKEMAMMMALLLVSQRRREEESRQAAEVERAEAEEDAQRRKILAEVGVSATVLTGGRGFIKKLFSRVSQWCNSKADVLESWKNKGLHWWNSKDTDLDSGDHHERHGKGGIKIKTSLLGAIVAVAAPVVATVAVSALGEDKLLAVTDGVDDRNSETIKTAKALASESIAESARTLEEVKDIYKKEGGVGTAEQLASKVVGEDVYAHLKEKKYTKAFKAATQGVSEWCSEACSSIAESSAATVQEVKKGEIAKAFKGVVEGAGNMLLGEGAIKLAGSALQDGGALLTKEFENTKTNTVPHKEETAPVQAASVDPKAVKTNFSGAAAKDQEAAVKSPVPDSAKAKATPSAAHVLEKHV